MLYSCLIGRTHRAARRTRGWARHAEDKRGRAEAGNENEIIVLERQKLNRSGHIKASIIGTDSLRQFNIVLSHGSYCLQQQGYESDDRSKDEVHNPLVVRFVQHFGKSN